jgi:hypothetical protein
MRSQFCCRKVDPVACQDIDKLSLERFYLQHPAAHKLRTFPVRYDLVEA